MKCEYCGITDNETRIINSKFGILCRKHYLQMYKHNKIEPTIYDRNEIIIHDDFAEIVIKDKQQNIIAYAQIDIEDVEKIKNLKWHIKKSRNTNYVAYNDKGRAVFLHRFILDYDGVDDVDHIDHNGLNNRKSNLRIISHSLNLMNQHNFNNGIKKTPSEKYSSNITINGKSKYLGTYDTFEEAKQARIKFEKTLY
jgi:AP2 domain.